MIKLLRIDDRLIHGQVAVMWVAFVGADTIIVANDTHAKSPVLTMTLGLGKPPGTTLVVRTVSDAADYLNDPVNQQRKIFVVVDSLTDAHALIDLCPDIPAVNIGGIRSASGKRRIGLQVFLNESDIQHAKGIAEKKPIYMQAKPDEKKVELDSVISLWEKAT